jgi:YfiH family protein
MILQSSAIVAAAVAFPAPASTLFFVLERRTSPTGIVYYISPLLAQAGVPHAFSTRIGGVSIKPFDSLNLGNPQGAAVQDEWQRIHENYRRLQIVMGAAGKDRCWVHQVHGGDVVFARQGHEFTNAARADALVSDDPQRVLVVRVADCVPILVASEDGKAVGAVHAGWRGVVAGAVPNALRELRRLTQRDLVAAVGPCISRSNFEVGAEVLEQFRQLLGEQDGLIQPGSNGKGHLDLRMAVQLQLMAAGVSRDHIDMTDRCTHRDAEEFYSHRRDRGITGRLAALIAAA